MSIPLVSVIVPAYNAERVLDRCLHSICKQTLSDIEIIVINDGSCDRTAQIADAWSTRDCRIQVIHQHNQGVAAARNTALSICRGTFIRFVDVDDELPENGISDLLNIIEKENADLVIAGFSKIVRKSVLDRNILNMEQCIPIHAYLKLLDRWSNTFFCGVLWNKLFRRKLIEENGCRFRSDLTLGEDLDFCIQYLAGCKSIALSRANVYRYICNTAGLTYHHAANCLIHPLASIHMKWVLYQRLKSLYIHHGEWAHYQHRLWLYLFRTTLSN